MDISLEDIDIEGTIKSMSLTSISIKLNNGNSLDVISTSTINNIEFKIKVET